MAGPLIVSLIPVNFLGPCSSRLECVASLLYMTAFCHETYRNVQFYHWGRNLHSRATNSPKFLEGHPSSITHLAQWLKEAKLGKSIWNWIWNWNLNWKIISKVIIYRCSHLVFCVPCRRFREAMLLRILAVTGMNFQNHLTSNAHLWFEPKICTCIYW